MALRYLTGDTHPDHDTVCACRRENGEAVNQAFAEVLHLAREMGLLKVGTASVDRTHIKANASKHNSVRYNWASELEQQVRKDIEELLARAEKSETEAMADDQRLLQKIARREALLEKVLWARQEREKRAKSKDVGKEERDTDEGPKPGSASPGQPNNSQQINFTDPENALMRRTRRDSYEQAHDSQAVVDAEGSQTIPATGPAPAPSDPNDLGPTLESVMEDVGPV